MKPKEILNSHQLEQIGMKEPAPESKPKERPFDPESIKQCEGCSKLCTVRTCKGECKDAVPGEKKL